ncbi:MAG: FtsH protease activity modulator HflK [Burkholderiaceae bacterium]|nr:MAG: FtsH protease activity modulator HflK [Burkholderiaceae bacterium]
MLGTLGVLWNLGDSVWGRRRGNRSSTAAQPLQRHEPVRQDGPPDLDDLWRDFNQKLNNLFGRKRPGGATGNGGNGNRGSGPDMKGASIGVGLIVGLVLMLWFGSGFFTVQEGQVGVILQFGQYKATTGSGFQWRLPYPFQSHEIVNVSGVRKVDIGYQGNVKNKNAHEALMLTDDENIIDIQFAVQYTLKDAGAYLFNNRDPDDAVKQAAETAMREVVGKSKMDYVLYEGREEVAARVSKLVQEILDRYKTGVLVMNITLQNAQPPEQVQAAFDDAVKAGQDRERQKSEGQAYANDVIPRARGAASRLQQEADGYAQQVVANAEGDAARFKSVMAEYSKAPQVTRQRLYLETMQKVFESTTKVMVDSRAGSNLLYLPLDKLIQQTAAQEANAAAAETDAAAAPASAAAIQNNRSRDALRNRDRENR